MVIATPVWRIRSAGTRARSSASTTRSAGVAVRLAHRNGSATSPQLAGPHGGGWVACGAVAVQELASLDRGARDRRLGMAPASRGGRIWSAETMLRQAPPCGRWPRRASPCAGCLDSRAGAAARARGRGATGGPAGPRRAPPHGPAAPARRRGRGALPGRVPVDDPGSRGRRHVDPRARAALRPPRAPEAPLRPRRPRPPDRPMERVTVTPPPVAC